MEANLKCVNLHKSNRAALFPLLVTSCEKTISEKTTLMAKGIETETNRTEKFGKGVEPSAVKFI